MIEWSVVVAATAAHAFFALGRSALIHLRRPRLLELEQKGAAPAWALQALLQQPERLLATAEIGALVSLVLASGVATLALTPSLQSALQAAFSLLNTDLARWGAVLSTALGTALFLFVFGRLLPEALALRHAERLAVALVRPMQVAGALLGPLALFATWLSRLLTVPTSNAKRNGTALITEEEIKTMVDAGEEEGLIEEEEKEIILSALDFGDTVAREVMVPRIDIVALDVNTPFDEALDTIISAGHSRIPVYRGTIDDIVGILYAKDMLKQLRDCRKPPLSEIVRQPFFTPESKRVSELLQELQKSRVHVAIVVDEFGGTAGLVTIEDILEEIVGEIQDEFDAEEPDVQPLPDGTGFIFDAGMNIEDVGEVLGVSLPEGESDTLGGFIYDQLGKVPAQGEVVEWDGLRFEVQSVSDRRILKVKVTPISEPAASDLQECNSAARDEVNPADGADRLPLADAR
ncbi:MAG: hemolysin family protein [Anaerolineae bacterium]|nr:hemolysin family protein [Thermoflexales bacterium]MDW8394958.1 hemolysin family protein [Anaerolineae bacterium]